MSCKLYFDTFIPVTHYFFLRLLKPSLHVSLFPPAYFQATILAYNTLQVFQILPFLHFHAIQIILDKPTAVPTGASLTYHLCTLPYFLLHNPLSIYISETYSPASAITPHSHQIALHHQQLAMRTVSIHCLLNTMISLPPFT